MRRRARARRHELDFLPAALEIQERPPSPAARVLALALVVLVAAAGSWAWLGRLDVVAVARGRLVAVGQSKVVQAPEAGIVRAVHVRDGTAVRGGDVLVELDPTVSHADEARLAAELGVARLHAARLRALLSGEELAEPRDADVTAAALHRELLRDQLAGQRDRMAVAALAVRRHEAALAAARATVARLEALVDIQTERASAFRRLLDQELVAPLQFLEVEERRVDRVQELAVERERLRQEQAALAEAERQRDGLGAEVGRIQLAELADWEARAAALEQERVKAARRRAVQRIRAPDAGIVQELALRGPGAVVTPAQPLLVLVPVGTGLELEAWIENKDAGLIEAGQAAEVKVDSFPFTRHGTIPGHLVRMSPDAVAREGQGLVYAGRIALARDTVRLNGRELPLAPGMLATAEIAVGRRRVAEYFLSPVLRWSYESLREP